MPISASPIQQAVGRQIAAAGTITVTLAAAAAAGNNLIASVGTDDETVTVTSITGGGVTWRRIRQTTGNGTGKSTAEIWSGEASSGAGTTILVGMSVASAEKIANVSEWSGLITVTPEDQTGGTNGSSVSPSSGTTPTTTQANELCIGAVATHGTATPSAGPTNSFTNFTSGTIGSTLQLLSAYRVVSATGSYSTGWTMATNTWAGAIATFKAAAATGIPTVNMTRNVV